jgi:hypothetical protein
MRHPVLKIPQVAEFPGFSPSGMRFHFIPYRKDTIKRVWKKNLDG